MTELLAFLGKIWHAVLTPEGAGAAGSILSLNWAPGVSKLAKLANVAGGFAFAVYVVPYIVEVMEVKSEKAPYALAFIGGMVGMNLLAKGWVFVQGIEFREIVNIILRRQDTPPKEKQ